MPKKTLALQQDLLRYFENDTIKVKINFEVLEEKITPLPHESLRVGGIIKKKTLQRCEVFLCEKR